MAITVMIIITTAITTIVIIVLIINKNFVCRYLKQNPDNKEKYPKLKNIDVDTVDSTTMDPGFETVAANYLKVSI